MSIPLQGGFFGGGLSGGTDGGGAPGDGLSLLAVQTANVSQATNPNIIDVFVAPADGLYNITINATGTVAGVGAGFMVISDSYTDPFGNPQADNFGGPNDFVLPFTSSLIFPVLVKGGTTYRVGINFDDAPAAAQVKISVTRVA